MQAHSRIVVIGPASWNTLVQVAALPEGRAQTIFARDSWSTLGGTSAGKALHLTDLGVEVTLCTVLGTDSDSDRISAALTRRHLHLVAERVAGPAERHLNLMSDDGGRLSVYLSTPEPPGATLPPEIVEAIADARDVVLDLSARSRDATGAARDSGAMVWTDLHDYDGQATFHQPFLDAADRVFLSADALGDPRTFMKAAVAAGKQLVVCTRGAEGAIALDSSWTWYEVPAEPATVVDTNGAGDAFFAGYLAASLGGANVERALQVAARQGARAVRSRHLSPLLDP